LQVENEVDIQKALDSLEEIPVDFVKLYDSRISGENYLATIQAAEKRGLITSGHMPFTVTLNETVEAGIDAIEHLYYIMKGCSSDEVSVTNKMKSGEIAFWEAMPLLMQSYTDSTANKTFTSLVQNNVYVVPTLHIGKTLSYLDEENHTNDAYLKYMTNGIIKTYEGRINRVANSSKEAIENRKRLDSFFGQLAKSLNDAGVGLLSGSDSGAFNSYTYPGISLHKELEEMVANGITPLDALRTSAYNGSKFLKKHSDYGTLTKNKIADLVLLNGNPLDKITNTQDIHTVIKTGQHFSISELETLLESTIAK
ncbi:MAG: amidohydrolase family protein, partial [Maribacter sp.]